MVGDTVCCSRNWPDGVGRAGPEDIPPCSFSVSALVFTWGAAVAYQSLVLIVCTANMCRSPMAEVIFRSLVKRAGDGDRIRVASAGTWGSREELAATYAQEVVREDGLDLSKHRSRILTQQDVDEADLILVMERAHSDDILMRFVRAEAKVRLLSEMAAKSHDIKDPYGGSRQAYEGTKQEIEQLLEAGYERIVSLSRGEERSGQGRGIGRWWPWRRG